MITNISNITFGNKIETLKENNYLYIKEYNEQGNLISYKEKDIQNDRFILSEKYDNSGKLIERQQFQYLKNKIIETVTGMINYQRTITEEIKDYLIHRTEEYISEDSSKNYIYKIIKKLDGKIISWINNGKKII